MMLGERRVSRVRDDRGASAIEYGLLLAGFIGLIIVAVYAFQAVLGTAFKGQAASVERAPGVAPPIPVSPPAAPTNLQPVAGNGEVVLTWSPSSGAASYTVNCPGGAVTGVGGTTYTCTGLTNWTPYTFSVIAVNSAGSSGSSGTVTATPIAPPSTPSLSGTAGDGLVNLAWTLPAHTDRFEVDCGNGTYTVVAGGGTTSATVCSSGLTNGTTYTFHVRACNAAGCSDPATLTATPQPNPPAAPTGVSGTMSTTGGVTATWNAVTGAVSYTVTCTAVSPGTGSTTSSVTAPTTSATCTGVTPGTLYTVSVQASNGGGSSPASGTVQVRAPFVETSARKNRTYTPAYTAPSGYTYSTCSASSGSCTYNSAGSQLSASTPNPGGTGSGTYTYTYTFKKSGSPDIVITYYVTVP